MPTYAGVLFNVERDGDGFTPYWHRGEPHVNREHIPHSNREVVQYGGKGNMRWEGQIYLDSLAEYAALEAVSGDGAGRDLNDFLEDSITSVRLNSISRPERDPIGEMFRCHVEFEYNS